MTDYVLIDGSYYCFYRYHAMLIWWKNATKDIPDDFDPSKEPIFLQKFKDLFIKRLMECIKKLKLTNPTIIVAKDCHRSNIWRHSILDCYKANRVTDDAFMGGPFFKMAYDELFTKPPFSQIIYHPSLEADDCVAITSRMLLEKTPDANITIIASDCDYLQLASPQIKIVTLQHKLLTDSKNSFKNAEKDLFCKIVTGDKSDNISGVFKKCGIKTAEKLFHDKDLFLKRLNSENANALYERNKMLVDFNMIPLEYVNEFKTSIASLL